MGDFDLTVVGSGVIGLAAAWRLGAAGWRVVIVDPHPGRGASYAAAGMLAPVTEAAYGEEEHLNLALRSAKHWPGLAAELEAASGLGIGFEQCGTLLVGADASDRLFLERLGEFHHSLGLDSRWCRASECRTLEPLLAPTIAGGLFAQGDQQVDNRRLLAALATAAERLGVTFLREQVSQLARTDGAVTGVRTREGSTVSSRRTLVAGGVASGLLAAEELPPPQPVKGQILRLRTPELGPRLTRTLRAIVGGSSVYIVPRADGRVVVGATAEEHPAARQVTVGGVYELLRDASQILPALKEYELLETYAAARPGSPDNAPIVGATTTPGLFVATGHYRNGILLTPVTLEVLTAILLDGAAPSWADALSPARFAGVTTAP